MALAHRTLNYYNGVMKSVYTGLVAVLCFLCYPAHLNAQDIQRAVTQGVAARQRVAALSRRANHRWYKQLAAFFEPPRIPYIPPKSPAQEDIAKFTFRLHRQGAPQYTASAFALEINGRVFGVTAGHVIQNTAQLESRRISTELIALGININSDVPGPYMLFKKKDGEFTSLPITSWRLSNTKGSDVAVFEIPPEALEHIHPLKLATKRAQPWQVASIIGFAENRPRRFPAEEILFATPHRLLMRKISPIEIDGMCGSPVLVNGKVVGLYVGAQEENVPSLLWAELLQQVSSKKLPGLHYASPIENIFPLINDLTGSHVLPGRVMKILGRPVAELRPQDYIHSIALIRNGKQISIFHPMELTDPEHLENFFKLQEHDTLNIMIISHPYTSQKREIFKYNVDVSTGQVTPWIAP